MKSYHTTHKLLTLSMDAKLAIIAQIKDYLMTCISERRFLHSSGAFSRQARLAYQEVALYLLTLPKLSLTVSLDNFLEDYFDTTAPIMSKSSISKARYKLSHRFFIGWNQRLCSMAHQLSELKTWKGNLVYGIDGSTGTIPDSPATRAVFGLRKNQHGQGALARFLVCYDVLNHFCERAAIVAYTTSERAVAYKWAQRLQHSGNLFI